MDMMGLIGDTPLIKICVKYKNIKKKVFVKLEYYNYTGSVKDRVAGYIISKSYDNGSLKKSMPIIEATSGNTGISFSALGALNGHSVHIFMPDWVSVERIKIMKLYGAKVYLVSKEEGGFQECIRRADDLAKKLNGFRPQQFSNELNTEVHYLYTADEIASKLESVSAFVCGFGTGGTLMGVSKKLKEKFNNLKTYAMEPENMALLGREKRIGEHKIEGIGDDFLPELIDKNLIDSVVTINDYEAINMSRRLAKNLGLGVGISSGANFLASVLIEEDSVVTIFADDMKKYLSTDLTKEDDKHYLSDEIEFESVEILN
jgi:cysteine synthase A